MARRDTKKLGRRARKKRQADHRAQEQRPEEEGRVGGLLTGMRRGTQKLVGAGSKPASPPAGIRRALDVLFWVAMAAVAVYFVVHVFIARR